MAKVRLQYGTWEPALYVTEDDGGTWTLLASGAVPYAISFDHSRPGRAVAVSTPYPPGKDTSS